MLGKLLYSCSIVIIILLIFQVSVTIVEFQFCHPKFQKNVDISESHENLYIMIFRH